MQAGVASRFRERDGIPVPENETPAAVPHESMTSEETSRLNDRRLAADCPQQHYTTRYSTAHGMDGTGQHGNDPISYLPLGRRRYATSVQSYGWMTIKAVTRGPRVSRRSVKQDSSQELSTGKGLDRSSIGPFGM